MTLTILLIYARPVAVWAWLLLRIAITPRGVRGWV